MVSPLVSDWEKDLVYLIQLPRAGCVPSLSPFALKLETWLRMAGIPYQIQSNLDIRHPHATNLEGALYQVKLKPILKKQCYLERVTYIKDDLNQEVLLNYVKNVDNEFKYKSLKGQIPFVELNGRQIADTNIIIDELTKIFHIQMDDQLVESSAFAHTYAIHSLIEDTLRWYCIYYRALNNTFFGTEDGVGNHFHGLRKFFFKHFILRRMRSKLMDQCKAQGVGRLTPSQVDTFARKHLKALSVLLGDKNYLMGDTFCSVDAMAFGHLCMFYYCPLNKNIKNFIESDCRNVVDYLRNIKEDFWPDWNEATSKLSLTTRRNKPQLTTTSTPLETVT